MFIFIVATLYRLSHVRIELARVTDVAVENQILMYGMRFVHDTDSTATGIEAFPTSEEKPVVLLSNSAKYHQTKEFLTPALRTLTIHILVL